MLMLAMLCWVGLKLGAPGWYWLCWSICMILTVVKFGCNMFKAGAKS